MSRYVSQGILEAYHVIKLLKILNLINVSMKLELWDFFIFFIGFHGSIWMMRTHSFVLFLLIQN